eukprot:403366295
MNDERIMTNVNYRLLNFHSKILDDIFKEYNWKRTASDIEKTKNLQLLMMCRQNVFIGPNKSLIDQIQFFNRIHNIEELTNFKNLIQSSSNFLMSVQQFQKKKQPTIFLRRYEFPEQVSKLQEDLDSFQRDERLKYILVWTDFQIKQQLCLDFDEKNSEQTLKLIAQRDQLNYCFIQETVRDSLIIYGQKVKLQFYAMINKFQPLQIQVFSEAFVKLYDGYLFIDREKITKAHLSLSEFNQLLEDRGFSKKKVNSIWSNCCQKILKCLFSIITEVNLITQNTFQIIQFTFELSSDFQAYIQKVKVDHKFPKRGNHFDLYKKIMLREILENTKKRIIKEQLFNQINSSINTPKFLYLLKRMQNDPNLSKNDSKYDESLELLLKEDYTKPKMRERTVQNISEELFKKIEKQQALIKKGQSVRSPNFDLILSSVKVEKTLIPIFYHYKKGKIELMNTFLQKASFDQPTSQRVYQEYLDQWTNSHKKQETLNQQQDKFRRENQNEIIKNKLQILKNHDQFSNQKVFLDEMDSYKVIKNILNLGNMMDFLNMLPVIKRFSENELQKSLFEYFKDSKQNVEIFTSQLKLIGIIKDPKQKHQQYLQDLILHLKVNQGSQQYDQNQNSIQQQQDKPFKSFLKNIRNLLLSQESSQLQQYKTAFKHLELKKSQSERLFSFVRKPNIGVQKDSNPKTLDQYLFGQADFNKQIGISPASKFNYSSQQTKIFTMPKSQNRKTLQTQILAKSTLSLDEEATCTNPIKKRIQTSQSSRSIKDKFSDLITNMESQQCIREAALTSRGRESLITPQSRNSFLYIRNNQSEYLFPNKLIQTPRMQINSDINQQQPSPSQGNISPKRKKVLSSLMAKRLQKVIPKTPRDTQSNYLEQIKQKRESQLQRKLQQQELQQNQDKPNQPQQQTQGFFSQRRQQRFEEEQNQIRMLKERMAFGIKHKLQKDAKQREIEQELINNQDDIDPLQYMNEDSNDEYDITQIENDSLKINSKKMREKYIQKVIEIHNNYKQQNTYMIQIFPFNKESKRISKSISYRQVVLSSEINLNEIDNHFSGRKKPIFVYQMDQPEQVQEQLVKLVAKQMDDFVFIRDTNTDILNSTTINHNKHNQK